jgi:hypothetical protein
LTCEVAERWGRPFDWARDAAALAADEGVKPLAEGPGNPTGKNRNGSNTTKLDRGASYLVRRLKRDAPDIAQALARGEYKSARAAGIAAGIVRVPTPYELLCRAWALFALVLLAVWVVSHALRRRRERAPCRPVQVRWCCAACAACAATMLLSPPSTSPASGFPMTDDYRARLTTPPEVEQLPSGAWVARRCGLAATGRTRWLAIDALVTKELLHCDPPGIPVTRVPHEAIDAFIAWEKGQERT